MCGQHDDPSQIDDLIATDPNITPHTIPDYAYEGELMRMEAEDRANDLEWARYKNSFGSWCHTINGDDDGGFHHNRARKGANEMRKRAFAKFLANIPVHSDSYMILHASGTASNIEIEYGIPTFKQNFFRMNER